jgi:hypothetical protein
MPEQDHRFATVRHYGRLFIDRDDLVRMLYKEASGTRVTEMQNVTKRERELAATTFEILAQRLESLR